MARSVLSICLILFFWTGIARPDNLCWSNADYHTTASGGHEDSHAIWTGGAHLCQMMVTNNAASTVWAMVFDSAAVPATGTKPLREFNVATNTTVGILAYGILIVNGISVACSSTEGTLTVTAASDCNFGVSYSR